MRIITVSGNRYCAVRDTAESSNARRITCLQAAALTSALRADGESFEYSYYHTAGYDSPYQLSGRHNEIWIPAQRQQQAQRLPSTPAKAATG